MLWSQGLTAVPKLNPLPHSLRLHHSERALHNRVYASAKDGLAETTSRFRASI